VRHVPVLAWLPHYRRGWFTRDAVAGLTVWALVVPEAMAYAVIAGVPVQYGLYAVPLALLGYVVFGGSQKLFVGPSASVATISAVAVGSVVAAGSDPDAYIALTAALALLVGVIYLVLGVARMGFVARFFAKPVLEGFIIGLGLYVAIGQLPKLVGIEKPSGDTVRVLVETVGHVGSWDWTTVAVGAAGLAALFAMGRFTPRAPGAVIVVVVSLLAAGVLSLADQGVALVGEVPTGFSFASWSGVTADRLVDLLPGAFAIVVVGLASSVAIAKSYAVKSHQRLDANQELIGYGAANIGAGVLQGYTVTGSLSKSAAANDAGGRTPVLLAVTSVLVVVTIVFLAGVFKNLPETILAAVIIHAVWGMIDFSKLARLWRAHLGEFWLAAGALAGVVVIDILPGVLIGVALSFMLLIRRLDHPRIEILGRAADGRAYTDLATHPDATAVPGILVYGFRAPLIFANAEILTDDLIARSGESPAPLNSVILDCQGMSEVDTTGADALCQIHDTLDALGKRLLLARVNGAVVDSLRRDGSLAVLGEDAIYPTVRDAVEAAQSHRTAPEGARLAT
jgi:high affinity sulfate transporter 1